MIPRSPDWRSALAEAVSDPVELLDLLDLDPGLLSAAEAAARRFGLRVPRGFLARMHPGDPNDPLLRQVLPLGAELLETPGFGSDPVGDLAATTSPGVLHKYRGRALLIATGACAVHCRYCFRREFPYSESAAGRDGWRDALRYLADRPEIDEVILSGGDPLVLPDSKLEQLGGKLAGIPHLKRLRIHSRIPVVLPERITPEFCGWIRALPMRPVMVIHANHPNEVSPEVSHAVRRLAGSGATLLNQAVLLAGVNDSREALIRLSESLFSCGVLPYYLHMLDPVRGAAHFEVGEERARHLERQLRESLPGYLVPRFVREHAGKPCKLPLSIG